MTSCVLSDGIDTLAARQASGDLPATVTVLPGEAGSGDEGTAMLEIVHDLAPGAELFFATAGDMEAAMATNIQGLQTTFGCDVMVDDIFFRTEPALCDGDGPIAQFRKWFRQFYAESDLVNLAEEAAKLGVPTLPMSAGNE